MAKTEKEIKIRNDEVEWEPRPTLGSADYSSAEVWDEEQEKIWWGEWICAGRAEEVPDPGDYIVRDIAGESCSSCATTPASCDPSTTCAATAARSSWMTSRARRTSARRSCAPTTPGPST